MVYAQLGAGRGCDAGGGRRAGAERVKVSIGATGGVVIGVSAGWVGLVALGVAIGWGMSEKLQFVIGEHFQLCKDAGQRDFLAGCRRRGFTFCNFSDI